MTPTPGILAPVLTPDGKLDELKTSILFTCPGCKRKRIAKAVTARNYACECGAVSRVEAEAGEWERIHEETKRYDMTPWRFVRGRYAKERARDDGVQAWGPIRTPPPFGPPRLSYFSKK